MQYPSLTETLLFRGTTQQEAESMLRCLGAHAKRCAKGETVCRAGEMADCMGLVLSGSVYIEHDDIWGNKSILGHAGSGEVFAEAYACIPGEPLMVNVAAAENSEVLFLDTQRLLTTCTAACSHHNRLIQNLLQILAQKNLGLSRRILHTSSKSIRGRLFSYLSEQARYAGDRRFTIPFNRQQLADYLSVDRSALSNELSKMQAEGILVYRKNSFTLR